MKRATSEMTSAERARRFWEFGLLKALPIVRRGENRELEMRKAL